VARNIDSRPGRRARAGVLLGATALIATAALAGCGSSSSGNSPSGGGSASTSAGSGGPVTIGFLWDVKGESAVDINDYENGANLAVKQLNAAGGLNGQPVKSFREPLPPLDLQKTSSNFLAAVGKKPSAMVGIPAPSQSQALASAITRAAIPVVTTDVGEPYLVPGGSAASPDAWFLGDYDPDISKQLTDYGVNTLGLKKIAILAGNDTYGAGGADGAKAELKALGQSPATVQTFEETATDVTSQVLAAKHAGADGVFSWSYPNTIAVQMKQAAQNGLVVPTLSGTSAEIAVESGVIPPAALAKLSIAVPCNFGDTSYSSSVAAFNTAYQAAYKTPASINAAWAYDGVMTIARAVKIAKSNQPSAINAAIPKVPSTPGACGVLQADSGHVLNHQLVFAKYKADGSNTTAKTVTLPDTPKGSQ
jgi:ABC-type branched-subunit amino acid transport system substrate-binding protein